MRAITLLLGLFGALMGRSTTYYVSISGDDANDGSSLPTAFATIQHAANIVGPGDEVRILEGSYQGFSVMDKYGSQDDPIEFRPHNLALVEITSPCAYNDLDGINVENAAHIWIHGFHVTGMPRAGIRTALSESVWILGNTCTDNGKWGILTGFAENVRITDNTCSGSIDEHGIYVSNSADNPTIDGNHCFDNNANGIHMNGDVSLGGDGIISNAQVYGNIIHGNGTAGGSGINCDGVVNSVIYNNLLYDNHASGISLYQIDGGAPSTGNKVYNNTVINASDARWCMNITEGCTGNRLLNNIFINQHPFRGAIVIADDALDGFASDYNLLSSRVSPDGDATILDLAAWQELGYDGNSIVAGPLSTLFVDIPAADYHAASATSQQVDAGTMAVLPEVSNDLSLDARPAGAGFDIGCYERGLNTSFDPQQVSVSLPAPYFMDDVLVVPVFAPGALISLVDAQGRLIMQAAPTTTELHLPTLAKGTYMVQMTKADGDHPSAWKIIR